MIYYITKSNPNLESPDLKGLERNKDIEILPLITLTTLFPKNFAEIFLASDSLIFTSKSAISALEENIAHSKDSESLTAHWHKLPHYVLSPKIASTLENKGFKVAFSASSAYGEIFVQEALVHLKDKNPLFIRAKKIAAPLPALFKQNGITLKSLIVYENHPIKLKNPPTLTQNSVIFFSAPSQIRAFLLNFSWNPNFTALCIGATTKKAAQTLLHNAKIMQSPQTNIISALEFAKTLTH